MIRRHSQLLVYQLLEKKAMMRYNTKKIRCRATTRACRYLANGELGQGNLALSTRNAAHKNPRNNVVWVGLEDHASVYQLIDG